MKIIVYMLLICTYVLGQNVLVLNSYSPISRWSKEQSESIVETLKVDKRLNIFVEYMDTKAFIPTKKN